MNRVLSFILFLSASLLVNAQEQLDSVFFRNGNAHAVNVIRSNNESIEYMYPNETVIIETYKTQLLRVKYRSGRVEECSELLKIKRITNFSDWENVVVTYLADDTKGLEKVSEISYVSGWGGAWAAGMGYNKAIQGLILQCRQHGRNAHLGKLLGRLHTPGSKDLVGVVMMVSNVSVTVMAVVVAAAVIRQFKRSYALA